MKLDAQRLAFAVMDQIISELGDPPTKFKWHKVGTHIGVHIGDEPYCIKRLSMGSVHNTILELAMSETSFIASVRDTEGFKTKEFELAHDFSVENVVNFLYESRGQ